MDELSSKLGMTDIAVATIGGRFGSWARWHAQQLAEANEREIWEHLHGQRHPYNVAIAVAVNYPFSADDLEGLAQLADSDEALLREALDKAYEVVNAGMGITGNPYIAVKRLAWLYLNEKRRQANEATLQRLTNLSTDLQSAVREKPEKPSRSERHKHARDWRRQSRQR